MIRHVQSCRAAKAGSFSSENLEYNHKHPCQSCSSLNLKCVGRPRCQKCTDLRQDCIFVGLAQQTITPELASGLPSPATDASGTGLEGKPTSFAPGSSYETSQNGPTSIRGSQQTTPSSFAIQPPTNHLLSSNWNGFEVTPTDSRADGNLGLPDQRLHGGFSPSNLGHECNDPYPEEQLSPMSLRTPSSHLEVTMRAVNRKGEPDGSQNVTLLTEPVPTDEQRATNKRGRYVSKACVHCQKRKVKCSGEPVCAQCFSAGLICAYNQSGKRGGKKRSRTERSLPRTAKPLQSTAAVLTPEQDLPGVLVQMTARIASLERSCHMLENQIDINADEGDVSSMSDSDYSLENEKSSQSGPSSSGLPSDEVFHGATSLLEPIEVLDRTVATSGGEQTDSHTAVEVTNSTPITWHNLTRSGNKAIETLEKETRLGDIAALRFSVDIFFSYLNPHYPCLNENLFRKQFDGFLTNVKNHELGTADRHQLITLINLIHAEVRILSDDWPDSTCAPAWEDFCRAESILNHLTWLGNGNILTIQCLIIKARYLLYAEKANAAYDTMSRAVRLCWQLGLHNQPSWKNCSPFEIVMRQRTFWTTFYAERNIAFNCGAPYLIRDSDFNVDLPPDLDDKAMFPDQPLPIKETPERSSSPYLSGVAKWCRLSAEIWDAVFGIKAQKPTSQEFIASMDARIQYTVSQLPAHLQWHRNIHRLAGSTDIPLYVLRQTIILHLVSLSDAKKLKTY